MDLRRPPRSSSGGVEPKIRQVGFFTPDASAPSEPLPPAAAAVPAPSAQLQRPAAGLPPAPDDLSAGRLSPVMIPPPRHADHLAPGPPSPAAADVVLATSAPVRSSPRLDVAFEIGDDDSWSRAPSAVELEENKRGLAEVRNEGAPASIPQKQKTSKAERRAIQEAQRAAKAAAKEADKSGKSAGAAMSKQTKPAKIAQKKDVPQAASTVASEKKATERPPEREQVSNGKTFVLSSANGTLTMQERPEVDGTDTAIHATFRAHPQDSTELHDIYSTTLKGASILIEPFDLPGTVITNNLTLSAQKSTDSLFNIVPGLDGNSNSVSLELGTRPGCFLVTGTNYSAGTKIQVSCKSSLQSISGILEQAASFLQTDPLRQYHPISFVAKGMTRNFLLEPLYSLRDEFYTVYFNIGA